MPEIGEVRSAKELGKKSDSSAYVYQPCPCCGLNPRWVRRPKAHRICVKCARKMMLDDKESGLTDKLISNGLARMSKNGRIEYKHTCRVCGKDGLWDQKRDIDRTCSLKCAHSVRLSGDKSPKWNGGRRITMGYSDIMIYSDNPFYAMSHDSGHGCHYIPEHRLVMAQHLGRCLESWEIVHHKNSDRSDNSIDNLELLPNQGTHLSSIILQTKLNKLQKRVGKLEEENDKLKIDIALLKWHSRNRILD